ncbi:MAG: Gfo/Idh/MocA family oxidoreductase [Pseudomonadota bacterium]|nr:Gfo/Idh/MocA family oxidoreductase [Pseudomonadota bacterium]
MSIPSYAIVGLGHRATMYLEALLGPHAASGTLSALCDINPGRLALAAEATRRTGLQPALFEDFGALLRTVRPDRVIVTVPDHLHADMIVAALDGGADVITEKPITMDAASCGRILEARRRTGRHITVGFNYRYSPVRTLLKQVLMSGIIGHVQGGVFEWLLDTHHGADYFRRWHRQKANSGGLFVHKATHHFDLLNWWLAGVPRRVTATGSRVFYTPQIAQALGLGDHGPRCTGCPAFDRCGVRLDLAGRPQLRALYLENEAHDGYLRDRCVFDPAMDIEDSMHATIEYAGGITIGYRLTAFSPAEGYRVVFDGTRGRVELTNVERAYVLPDGSLVDPALEETNRIVVQPHFSRAYELRMPAARGLHGGGDKVMLGELFGSRPNDEYGRVADERAGVLSAAVGIAANASLTARAPVLIEDVIEGLPVPDYPQAPFGPDAIWQSFDPARYPFLEGALLL